jgi:hypothetical protein
MVRFFDSKPGIITPTYSTSAQFYAFGTSSPLRKQFSVDDLFGKSLRSVTDLDNLAHISLQMASQHLRSMIGKYCGKAWSDMSRYRHKYCG